MIEKLLANYSMLCYIFIIERLYVSSEATPKKVKFYKDKEEKEPFTEWLRSLRDGLGKKRILARLRRVEQGNYGDCDPVGDGVFELRLHFGPGYRIYFGEQDKTIVIILCGGDKSSQQKDIEDAKLYWKGWNKNA